MTEIERLWTGINQAMTLLAQDGLLDTGGYRRLQALLKDDYDAKRNTAVHFNWLDTVSGGGPC